MTMHTNEPNHPNPSLDEPTGAEIAVIGMACRFPGAHTPEEFWRNLREGVESLTELTDEELLRAGEALADIADPRYVRRASVVDGIEEFDADFFGYTSQEVLIMDPQHRLFLECAWEVLERGGWGDPERHPGPIGVFTGAKTNTHIFNVVAQRHRFPGLDNFQIALGNDLASMATRVSYKFNLRGPSYALHTACSTSLVAVHLACQSLLLDECVMAIAGGASVNIPQRRGYLPQHGGILSPDGSSRTFDEGAAGSNFGNGCGAVLLKRLEEALADGDPIHCVIRGSATNNDGAAKASFTAPGVEGQTAVLIEAMACAGVEPSDVSYLEAHGTATELGDSIEILALKQAFAAESVEGGARPQHCALGSAKTNLGHLEVAAGVAGLMKTALALEHRELPPSLHFQKANPRLELESTPFEVNTTLQPWENPGERKRIAGVSSFGIGSTNAHVIVEEAPRAAPGDATVGCQILLLSARSADALDAVGERLALCLEEEPHVELADVAYTLAVGRQRFAHRRAITCETVAEAVAALRSPGPDTRQELVDEQTDRATVFLLPGLGDQAPDLARGLYEGDANFRSALERCAAFLEPLCGEDLLQVLYPPQGPGAGTRKELDLRRMLGRGGSAQTEPGPLDHTRVAQPLLFALEYALARMWIAQGVKPQALLGYSLGEYVAACLAGTLSLEGALTLVARRAQLIDTLPSGAMLAVTLSEAELLPLLGQDLSLAAVNGPEFMVAAGSTAAVDALAATLAERGVACQRLATTHAFHSRMMEPIAARFAQLVRGMELQAPKIPWVSNVTGTWISAAEATDPDYWVRHLCQPVRFGSGVETLLAGDGTFQHPAVVELGTGQSLATFVKLHPSCDAAAADRVVATLPSRLQGGVNGDDLVAARKALGRLWLAGVRLDPDCLFRDQRRRRVTLPTYPFERQRLWLDPVSEEEFTRALRPAGAPAPSANPPSANPPSAEQRAGGTVQVTLDKAPDPADWLWRPQWQAAPLDDTTLRAPAEGTCTLLLGDDSALATSVAEHGRARGLDLVELAATAPGTESSAPGVGEHRAALDPDDPGAWSALLEALRQQQRWPATVILLWNLRTPTSDTLRLGFFTLMHLAQALGRLGNHPPVHLLVLTRDAHRITGAEEVVPEQATVLGPAKVIPQESPAITCHAVDVELPAAGEEAEFARRLFAELQRPEEADVLVAWRGVERLARDFVPHPPAEDAASPLRDGGTYLITGGLGGLGLVLAEHLGRTRRARLVLVGRSTFPAPADWQAELDRRPAEDATSIKIRTLQALEEVGAEVMVCAADVADSAAMVGVRAAVLERFGALDGIVHTAGIPGGGIVQLKTDDMARTILRPKVEGARTLLEVFGDLPLDFLAIYSSVASILGEFGQADYCGANAYLDALAASRWGQAPPVRAINWDIWQEVGLAVYTEVPAHLQEWRDEMLSKGIAPSEGVEIFERILALDEPQTIVSTQNLHARIDLGRSFTGERFLEELGIAGGGTPAAPGAGVTGGLPTDRAELEHRLTTIWRRILGRESLQVGDNFFDLGGNSLIGLQLVGVINQELGTELIPVELFEHPSIRALARHLLPTDTAVPTTPAFTTRGDDEAIAIIGMAGRFPGAGNPDELWENLRAGVESVRFFSGEDLLAAGVDPELLENPLYVRAGSVIDDIDLFDAALFGYSPREAEVMDPQQRIFLECAWEALESAACDPHRYPGRIGVFAGSNLSTYLLQLHGDPEAGASVNLLQAILGNDKDALTTRASYKLNLRGPSIGVQTFCSTSLVAIHMAARSLLDGDCDAALAGGIRVVVPSEQGYLWEERGIAPRDGHTYSFDARATGAVLGNGAGVVMLKRLRDALAEGDPIRAVLLGSAINNDGAGKAGYTAPSVEGQVQVARDALRRAGVDASTVSYVEAHGSATELGDPIEVTALSRAYATARETPCALGSVKSNFGHLDRAAGAAGVIKTVLALERRELPPSINYEQPNPQIDFAASPFRVQTELAPWQDNGTPRRAAVNSLGMGGTNAHVVLEEAPAVAEEGASERPWQLLVLSAHSPWSLEQSAERLAGALEKLPETSLAAVAQTLQSGRQQLRYRRALACRSVAEARSLLKGSDPKRVLSGFCEDGERSLVFLFPGLGGQYAGMGHGLYRDEPVFRAAVDRCADFLEPLLGTDLREVIELLADQDEAGQGESDVGKGVDFRALLRRREPEAGEGRLARAAYAQPALFVIEYALSQVWLSWGLRPTAMLGYSIGEYVAACVAGVLSLEDALTLVARRAQLIEELPGGGMLAVALGAPETEARIASEEELWTAASNTPEQTVVAGPSERLEALAVQLDEEGIAHRRLGVSHAFHSGMLDRAAAPLTEIARGFHLSAPRIPYLSNVTGTWMSDADAVDPGYWSRHMCSAVRFSEGLGTLLGGGSKVMVELGPQALASLVLQHPANAGDEATSVFAALRHAFEPGDDSGHLQEALGKAWLAGVEIDWAQSHETLRRRLVLPTYAFDRQRYWIETRQQRSAFGGAAAREEVEETASAAGGYARPQLRIAYVAPTTETQKAICGLWSELLGVDDIGIHDSFLELGGDSLLASRLISRMREVFQLELPIRLFFEASTVTELSAAVEQLRAEEEERELEEMMEKIQTMSEEDLDKELLRMESLVESEDER